MRCQITKGVQTHSFYFRTMRLVVPGLFPVPKRLIVTMKHTNNIIILPKKCLGVRLLSETPLRAHARKGVSPNRGIETERFLRVVSRYLNGSVPKHEYKIYTGSDYKPRLWF